MNLSGKIFLIILIFLAIAAGVALFFVFTKEKVLEINQANLAAPEPTPLGRSSDSGQWRQTIPTPKIMKAVYLTSWSAGTKSYIDSVINLAKESGVNAVVIDLKDSSGYVAYNTDSAKAKEYKTIKAQISDINSVIDTFRQKGIYVIGRLAVFQDPALTQSKPSLAIQSKEALSLNNNIPTQKTLWKDNKGLSWADPSNKEVWDYNIEIAKDALLHNFDEINFDYIRFPSNGKLKDMSFSSWDDSTPEHIVIREFFREIKKELSGAVLSADLFGVSATYQDDLGVGQILENAFEFFDYVCPMAYPSHYAKGVLGYDNPAEHPYEIVKDTMENAQKRLVFYNQLTQQEKSQLRPWLQAFDMGAVYDEKMVKLEIKAVSDVLGDNFAGYMLWNPANIYKEGFFKED